MTPTRDDERFEPLTPELWDDLELLFGERGACGGCWCMAPRLTRSEFERGKGDANRDALRALVMSGRIPGLLAYHGDEPVAWVAIEPREVFGRLARSRIHAPVDDAPVWSVVCLFLRKDQRRGGLSTRLLRAAVEHVRGRGGPRIVEGYPFDLSGPALPDAFVWTGLLASFERAGFREVARRSRTRPIVRLELS